MFWLRVDELLPLGGWVLAARQMGFVLNAVGPASLRWRGLVRVLNGAVSVLLRS